MLESLLLGALQGVTEWLPVSSGGVVALTNTALFDRPMSEAVAYAMWLHAGTALAAAAVFRTDIALLLQELLTLPRRPSPLFIYLFVSTAVSAIVSIPLLVFLQELSGRVGALAMVVVGVLMLGTGGLQLRGQAGGRRGVDAASGLDGVVVGIAQGVAVLPGLSRSGLTVAALLARRVDRSAALTLSFLMSIPASVAASTYFGFKEGFALTSEGIAAGLVAAIVGLLTIKALIAVAERINFGPFVIGVGSLIVVAGVWQAVAV